MSLPNRFFFNFSIALILILAVPVVSEASLDDLPRIFLENTADLTPQDDYRYQPGSFVLMIHSSIEPGDKTTVVFSGGTYYEVEVQTIDTYNGAAMVCVPYYYNQYTGGVCGGYVYVYVKGYEEQAVRIYLEDPEETGLTRNTKVLELIWDAAVREYMTAQSNLEQIAARNPEVDLTNGLQLLQDRIDDLSDWLTQIYFQNQLTLADGGQTQTISAFDLGQLDRILLAQIKGWYERDQVLNGTASTPIRPKEALWTEADLKARIQSIINEAKRASEGNKVVIGVVSLTTGAVALVYGGPMGGVAAAGGMAVTYFSACYDLGSAAVFEGITDSTVNGDGGSVEILVVTQDQLKNLGLQGASLISGPMGKLASFAGSGKTLAGVIDSLRKITGGDGGGGGGISLPEGYEFQTYYNFNGAMGSDYSKADLKISGDPNIPTLSWEGNRDIVGVQILDTGGLFFSYCIIRDPGQSRYLSSPVTYGDYSISGTEPCASYRAAPKIYEGYKYKASICGESASVGCAEIYFKRVR